MGRPIKPKNMYANCVNKPKRTPKNEAESKTKKVCIVKGTGVKGSGIRIKAPKLIVIIKNIDTKAREML